MKEWPQAQIVILTSYLDNEKIYPVLEAGTSYILKHRVQMKYYLRFVKLRVENMKSKLRLRKSGASQALQIYEDLTARERNINPLAKGMIINNC